MSKRFTREDGSSIIKKDAKNLNYFYIIHNFGHALSYYFNHFNKRKINLMSIYMIVLKVIDILEIVHLAGYVHIDISFNKILLTQGQLI